MKNPLPGFSSRLVVAIVPWVMLGFLAGCVAASQGPAGPGSANPGAAGDDDTTAPVTLPPCSSFAAAVAVATVADPALEELSGIVASRRHTGLLWVIEDSGAGNEVVALDHEGGTLGTLRLEGAQNIDWEDLALAPCGAQDCLWVGDVGDNLEDRETVQLIRLVEPDLEVLDPGSATAVSVDVFPFSYPDGPQNAEALVVSPEGLPAVLTKANDGFSRVYSFSKLQVGEQSSPELVTTIPTAAAPGLAFAATAADLSADGERLIVRTYAGIREYGLAGGGLAAAASAPVSVLPAALEPQGEAVAYDDAGRRIWQVSEGVNPTLFALHCKD